MRIGNWLRLVVFLHDVKALVQQFSLWRGSADVASVDNRHNLKERRAGCQPAIQPPPGRRYTLGLHHAVSLRESLLCGAE